VSRWLDGVGATAPAYLYPVPGLAEHTDNAFRWALVQMAERLGADPNWFAAVMANESARTFSPSVRNPMGGATGLIQFMPATAKRLGTTTDELAAMTATRQLEYVEKYYKPFAGRMHSVTDVYMVTFMPGFVGQPPDFVLGREGDESPISGGLTYDAVYRYNKGFDHDHKGAITVADVGQTVERILAAASQKPPIEVHPEEPGLAAVTGGGWVKPIAAGGVLGAIALFFLRIFRRR